MIFQKQLHRIVIAILGFATFAALASCGDSSDVTSLRLADIYDEGEIEGELSKPRSELPRTEWTFDSSTEKSLTDDWASYQVSRLRVSDGKLIGKASTDFPILHAVRNSDVDDRDVLHSIEVKLKASGGSNLSLNFSDSEEVDLAEVQAQAKESAGWRITTPIVSGDDSRIYTLKSQFTVTAAGIRNVFIRPTDAKGATFEIESVRLIFLKEYLSNIPSGVGWHGLAEIYHETVVTRAPEKLSFDLTLPREPWLDLSIGTIEDGPLTFKVEIEDGSSSTVLLEKTISTPHRWRRTPLELQEFSGKSVKLSFSLTSDNPGTLGYWGSPTIQSRNAGPNAKAEADPDSRNSALGPAPRGVILIICDTMRSDHLSAYDYGRETTPAMIRMADQGVLFKQCIAQGTWTKVSVPSILTSLYPSVHGIKKFTDRLSTSIKTMAEVFSDAGYATIGMSSVLFTGQFTDLHRGFDELHESGSIDSEIHPKTSREYVDRLLPWIELHKDSPFFVMLHVFDPHDPYEPYSPYNTLWADPAMKEVHEQQMKQVREVIANPTLKRFGMPNLKELQQARIDPEAFISHIQDWYDGSIRGMDVEIARLYEGLRNLDLDDKTLVVLTSDHGEEFLDHGATFHGQSVYSELSHVPLIIRQPGTIEPSAPVETLVQSIDIMPTILEISGITPPDGIQGQSLVPLLVGGASGQESADLSFASEAYADAAGWTDRPAVTEKAIVLEPGGATSDSIRSVAIVKNGWKLIQNTPHNSEESSYELFEYGVDPLDQKDLSGERADILKELIRDLEAWQRGMDARKGELETKGVSKLSADELERLRSLGYIK